MVSEAGNTFLDIDDDYHNIYYKRNITFLSTSSSSSPFLSPGRLMKFVLAIATSALRIKHLDRLSLTTLYHIQDFIYMFYVESTLSSSLLLEDGRGHLPHHPPYPYIPSRSYRNDSNRFQIRLPPIYGVVAIIYHEPGISHPTLSPVLFFFFAMAPSPRPRHMLISRRRGNGTAHAAFSFI